MWCNGHVVMQTQAPRKPPRPDKAAAHDDDEAASAQAWFQYPVEDPLERADLFSELFGDAQAAVDGGGGEDAERGGEAERQSSRMMPPPRPAHAPREEKACPGDGAGSSVLTIGSSFCGSNHVQTPKPPGHVKGDVARARDAAAVTSSATRARSCTTKSEQPGPAASRRSGKRKQSDATDAEDQDEGLESADATCEPAQRMTTAKRRRAAQVHNLSERRRRDRINEKMKALQELIPHCNKADKASMLDEAIEYLKSLQLQLQVMWMGGGMAPSAPVVFPAGVHQYMQRTMVAAAGRPPHVASLPAGVPPFVAPPPAPDLYARYLAVDRLPPPPLVPPPYTAAMGFYPRQNPPTPAAVPATSPSERPKIRENCGKPEIQGMTG